MGSVSIIAEGMPVLARHPIPSVSALSAMLDPQQGELHRARSLPEPAALDAIEAEVMRLLRGVSTAEAAVWTKTLVQSFPARREEPTAEYALAVVAVVTNCPARLLPALHARLVQAHDWSPSAKQVADAILSLTVEPRGVLNQVNMARLARERLAQRDARDAAHDARWRAEQEAKGKALSPANDELPKVRRHTPPTVGPVPPRNRPTMQGRGFRR